MKVDENIRSAKDIAFFVIWLNYSTSQIKNVLFEFRDNNSDIHLASDLTSQAFYTIKIHILASFASWPPSGAPTPLSYPLKNTI